MNGWLDLTSSARGVGATSLAGGMPRRELNGGVETPARCPGSLFAGLFFFVVGALFICLRHSVITYTLHLCRLHCIFRFAFVSSGAFPWTSRSPGAAFRRHREKAERCAGSFGPLSQHEFADFLFSISARKPFGFARKPFDFGTETFYIYAYMYM